MNLEESTTETVSPMLEKIIRRVQSQNSQSKAYESSQKDYMFILIIVLMSENGFMLINSDLVMHGVDSIDSEQLSKWKSNSGVYEATLAMPGMENFPLKVIMSPLGAMVLLNVVINNLSSETYSVCLPVSRYVVSPQASTIPMIFRDLKHLSTTYKNKILSAVKSAILTHLGYPSACLIGIPEEIFFKIMLYLPIYDVIKLSMLSRRLNYLIDKSSLWHELCNRDFKNPSPADGQDWKQLYKELYLAEHNKKLSQASRLAGSMHDYMDYSDFVSYIDNPMWDVII